MWGSYPSGAAVRGCRVSAHGFALAVGYWGGGEWLTQPTDPGAGARLLLVAPCGTHAPTPWRGSKDTGIRQPPYQATPSAARTVFDEGLVPRDHVAGLLCFFLFSCNLIQVSLVFIKIRYN